MTTSSASYALVKSTTYYAAPLVISSHWRQGITERPTLGKVSSWCCLKKKPSSSLPSASNRRIQAPLVLRPKLATLNLTKTTGSISVNSKHSSLEPPLKKAWHKHLDKSPKWKSSSTPSHSHRKEPVLHKTSLELVKVSVSVLRTSSLSHCSLPLCHSFLEGGVQDLELPILCSQPLSFHHLDPVPQFSQIDLYLVVCWLLISDYSCFLFFPK